MRLSGLERALHPTVGGPYKRREEKAPGGKGHLKVEEEVGATQL